MIAFKSRLSATLDFPRFKEAAYLEAAVCFEDGLDVVGSADEFPTADADNGPDIEEAAAEADESAMAFACADTAPNDAAPMPTNPASEAVANRASLDRADERSRAPKRPNSRCEASSGSSRRNHVFVVFAVLFISPVLRDPSSDNIPLPGQHARRTVPKPAVRPPRHRL